MSYKPTTCHFCGTQYPEHQATCDQCNAPILKVSNDKVKKEFKFSSDQKALVLIACFTLLGAVLIYLFLPSMQANSPTDEEKIKITEASTIKNSSSLDKQNNILSTPSYHSYIQRTLISSVYSVAINFRLPIIEYYGITGELPQSKKMLKKELGEDMEYSDKYIKSISIPKDGIVKIALTDKFGKNKFITYTPIIADGKWNIINWSCTSNLPQKNLGSRSLACKSTIEI